MTYFEQLISEAGPRPESSLGSKPTNPHELSARAVEARRLTELLEADKQFSFVRLGDMDLALLLASQDGQCSPEFTLQEKVLTGTSPSGAPGISVRHAERLRRALENADYVDFHERLWPVGALLPRLHLNPKAGQNRNPDVETSYILLTWMEHEFHGYCSRQRVGFVGAEAAVLSHLSRSSVFRQAASIWPQDIQAFFHQPRSNGDELDRNLDGIKEDLRAFVSSNEIDTLFISLGGGAKILCYELAKELNIRCIDFGAMLRGLCYLGSDGNRAGRSTHYPFYHRLDFDVVMDAVEKIFPQLAPQELLAKAHAQVILDLQRKEVGWTSGSNELCVDAKNRNHFARAYSRYLARYAKLPKTPSVGLERKKFYYFCGVHKLTVVGFLYYFAVNFKGMLFQSK
jgi:hypothetical protein